MSRKARPTRLDVVRDDHGGFVERKPNSFTFEFCILPEFGHIGASDIQCFHCKVYWDLAYDRPTDVQGI